MLFYKYHISLINITFLISTALWYYVNTNNIDVIVNFISGKPSNSTAYHFANLGTMENYRVMMIISSIVFEL